MLQRLIAVGDTLTGHLFSLAERQAALGFILPIVNMSLFLLSGRCLWKALVSYTFGMLLNQIQLAMLPLKFIVFLECQGKTF